MTTLPASTLLLRLPVVGIAFFLGMASLASASSTLTYTLDQATANLGTSPYATVTLTQDGNNVDVTVTPLNSDGFVKITGSGNSLAFNVDLLGSAAAITISSVTTGFAAGTGPFTAGSYGSFEDVVFCTTGCGSGGASHPDLGPLTFTVSLTDGSALTLADFDTNSGGYFFASDIVGTNTRTGNVSTNTPGVPGGTDPPTAPEPSSLSLMGASLIALGLLGRHLLRAKKQA